MQSNEACDDGNKDSTDGCTSSCTVARCGDGFLGSRERQVVDQAEAVTLPERAHLVLAIGVERGEVELEPAALDATEIDRPLLPIVPDDEFAPFIG